jgi:ribonuclease HII
MTRERPSLSDLRERYVERGRPLPAHLERQLEKDPRQGARAILTAVRARRKKNRAEGQRVRKMLRYESELWSTGVSLIAGCDEAGMSPLAGPVVAAAVILPIGCRLGADDSKKLTPEEREQLAPRIREIAICFGIGVVEPEDIDRLNIYWAGIEAMRRALRALRPKPEHVLLDGRKIRDLDIPQSRIVHGDALSLSIAAASIVAKTHRDARMIELDNLYPGYGFARHKGYPVQEHQEALMKLGPLPIHRRSFAPVREAMERHGGRS